MSAEEEKKEIESPAMEKTDPKETESERKARMKSIILVDVAVCILLIGFTIVSPGLYPYMKQACCTVVYVLVG